MLKPFCSLPSLLFQEPQNNTFLHGPGRGAGGGGVGKRWMSSVGITVRDSPTWSSYIPRERPVREVGDLLIYAMYAGYLGRETMNTLTQKRFVSNEIWTL